MPDKPAAEIAIDSDLIRALLVAQALDEIPDAADLPLAKIAEGWDTEVWRLGHAHAVRLPRRALAAPLVQHEQTVLPGLAERLAPTGVRVPAPVVDGVPAAGYPWPWSVVPWMEGERAMDESRAARGSWAPTLARALDALHVDAPEEYPMNRFRGVPLATRADAVAENLRNLEGAGKVDATDAQRLARVWGDGLAAAPWNRSPVWIHGDLHPGNLVSHDGTLAGIIDFGDVTAGDPAYDLAIAWLAFDATGRSRFIASAGSRYDVDVWVRARAWAAAVAVIFLAHSNDNPDYFALGREAATEVLADHL